MKFTPRRFFYILCGLLVLVIAAGGTSYYYLTTKLNENIATMAQKQAQVAAQGEQLSHLQDLRSRYNRLTSSSLLATITEALPPTKNESEIALQLHAIAAQSGMTLSNLSFPDPGAPSPLSQTVKDGDALAIPLSFTLGGTYPQLQSFLTKQELLSRYTSITSLSINNKGGDQLTFTINLNAYLKP